MTIKEFAAKAIKNGYNGGNDCNGWEWIKENLHKLDYIFQTEEYKQQKGMKYKCMPLLLKGIELNHEKERVIGTAWYLNNGREREREKEAFAKEMIEKGFLKLTEEVVRKAFAEKKKLDVMATRTMDIFSMGVNGIYKPFIDRDGDCMLMKPKAKKRGYYLSNFENAFCKIK